QPLRIERLGRRVDVRQVNAHPGERRGQQREQLVRVVVPLFVAEEEQPERASLAAGRWRLLRRGGTRRPRRTERRDRHRGDARRGEDRKSTRLNSSHVKSSYAVFCLKKK